LNPQQIFKKEDQKSSAPKDHNLISDKMKTKVSETYRKLTEVTNVDYNFDLYY
jgi:hypothetical protein